MILVLLFIFNFALLCVSGQDCKVGGKTCVDHEQCCGGCCFYGECIDTYRSCFSSKDVCEDHVCTGEEDCVVFIPPECSGCEPIALCRLP